MMPPPADPGRPLSGLPLAAGQSPPAVARHETVLEDEPAERVAALRSALGAGASIEGLRRLVAAHPADLEAWARLGERLHAAGDELAAYAAARVAYHRGLDRLRRSGWGGTGMVRWSRPSNRGFLRGLRLLLVTAAALGELDEASRCRQFLIDLDPDDSLGAGSFPEQPGPMWEAPPPPP